MSKEVTEAEDTSHRILITVMAMYVTHLELLHKALNKHLPDLAEATLKQRVKFLFA